MAGRKANFQWTAVPDVANTTWAQTASGTVSFFTLTVFTDPGTIRRIIVDAFVAGATAADAVRISGRVGIILATDRVVAAGAAAVPAPITSGESDWLWNRGYALHQEVLATEGSIYIPLHLHDDVRGMRKFKENDQLIFCLENAAGAPVDCMVTARVLLST